MTVWKCKTHNVILTVEGNRRVFTNPPGAYGGMPQCQLHLMLEPKEGKFRDCEIEKVS